MTKTQPSDHETVDPESVVAAALAQQPVFDGHNDLLSGLRARSGYAVAGLDTGRPDLQTDIPRLRAGGVGAQFWSVFVPSDLAEPAAAVATMEQVDAVYRMAARYPETFAIAYTAAGVRQVQAEGRIASLLGIEGGHSIATSLGVLRGFARLGVRYMTLTHNDNNGWADSATDEPRVGGLNEMGRAVVAEMNRIGMLVDLSHVAATTMRAALDVTTAPVIFSHSSCRAICDHPRDVPDDVLERLAGNGGVIQITFVPSFVSEDCRLWREEAQAVRKQLGFGVDEWTWPRAPRPGEDAAAVAAEIAATTPDPARNADYRQWLSENPRPQATIGQVADHVEHARETAGLAHIGLGGDYDGTDDLPVGLEDVSGYPRLLAELATRGWSADDLAALTGGNVLRVLEAAETAAPEPLWPLTPLR